MKLDLIDLHMAGLVATSDYESLLKILEDETTNAHEIQEKLLEDILKRNGGTEYLSTFLNGQTDKKLFKKNVPIVSYEDIKPYIDRLANGESSDFLSAESITGFFSRYCKFFFFFSFFLLFLLPGFLHKVKSYI